MRKDRHYHEEVHRHSMENLNARRRKKSRLHIDRQKGEKEEERQLTNFFAIHLSALIRRSRTTMQRGKTYERRRT